MRSVKEVFKVILIVRTLSNYGTNGREEPFVTSPVYSTERSRVAACATR